MKKRGFKATVALFMAFAALLSACQTKEAGGSAEDTGKQKSEEPSKDQDYSLPIVKGGSIELTYGTADNYYAPKSLTQGLPVWQEIEKKTGVKIKWDVAPSSQYADTMKVRLAAAKNLPDIISIPEADPVRLASNELIVPMDDLIKKYAPNIRKFFKQFPELEKSMKTPDGKIYALSSVVTGAAFADPYGLLIRQDWLDKLGLAEPKTLDDWYNVLKAFKERDPNGNGKADEIPFSPRDNLRGMSLFGSALGLHLFYSNGYYPDDKGKIQYEWMDDRARQLVVWLNKLYKEGLIDPQFMTNNGEQVDSNITRNLVGLSNHFINNTNRFNAAQKQAGVANANWQITLPPSGDGYKGFYEKYGPISGWHAITKDSKHPDIAMKWLDYTYASEEGARYVAFGIEGKSYTMVDGKPEFTDWVAHNPDGLSFNEALRALGAMPTTAWIRSSEGPLSYQPVATLKLDPPLAKQADKVKSYLIDSSQYMLGLPTLDESQDTAQMMTDLTTYQNETLAKFITGQAPIDWNQFVSKLKSMGIEQIIKIKQAQYDRMKNQK